MQVTNLHTGTLREYGIWSNDCWILVCFCNHPLWTCFHLVRQFTMVRQQKQSGLNATMVKIINYIYDDGVSTLCRDCRLRPENLPKKLFYGIFVTSCISMILTMKTMYVHTSLIFALYTRKKNAQVVTNLQQTCSNYGNH